MNDKELLEFAAKAAGLEVTGYIKELGLQYVAGSEDSPYTEYFNPLTDDGDALRLAVKLELLLIPFSDGMKIESDSIELFEFSNGDAYAATRRAIVRAAAEIGKELQ